MAFCEARTSSGHLLGLPLELQLRVMEELGGPDLCAVEASCRDLRRLVTLNAYLYQLALVEDFGPASALTVSSPTDWKAQYVHAFVKIRLDTLEQQKRVYNSLKLRLEELDDLLEQADDVKELLGAPELLMSEPSMVLAIVGDMEQDVLQQRWDAADDLMMAEVKLEELQAEMQALVARVPRCWWTPSLLVVDGGCTMA